MRFDLDAKELDTYYILLDTGNLNKIARYEQEFGDTELKIPKSVAAKREKSDMLVINTAESKYSKVKAVA